jgi:hypothetical protein
MKKTAIISTYGPTSYGMGHDTEMPGQIEGRASTSNGVKDFEGVLQAAVERYGLQRGDAVEIIVIPANVRDHGHLPAEETSTNRIGEIGG